MIREPVLECTFLLPRNRDPNLADGQPHEPELWEWLKIELYDKFRGGTVAPGWHRGFYEDEDTQQRVDDESRKYTVAVAESRLDELRSFLSGVCVLFAQKCIYLSVAGHVEFIEPAEPAGS
jgi:hypothetical protein